MRVLLVPSSDYVGHPFPQRHNQIFERLCNRKNLEVHVIRFKLFDEPRLKTKLVLHELSEKRTRHVAVYYLTNMFDHTSQIRQIIREEGIDVVVLSNLATPFAYTLMNEISSFRVPVIFDLPDYYPTSATGYIFGVRSVFGRVLTGVFDSMLRYMVRHATATTVASHALEEYVRRIGGRNVMYVPNGIGECFLRLYNGNIQRERFDFHEKDLVAGYVGSLEFWLDMKSFIDGVSLARSRGLPLKIWLIGSKLHTNFSDKVMQWIKQRDLERHTEITGFIAYEDVPKYVAGFNIGMIPFDVSNPTSFYAAPNKMWEYFSQKKPVLSTPIYEALCNSNCVFTASTPEDYAQKILALFRNKTEVRRKTEIGYRKALDRTWKRSAEIFASAIYSVIDEV